MLKIDIGCGSSKQPNFIGVDIVGEPDILCDISSGRLPFDDQSAEHIFSAHCLEHIAHNNLPHALQEISRVAADNALIEFWHPHPFHGDAFVIGHVNYLSEALYAGLHIYWKEYLGARWILKEVRYHVEPHVLQDLEASGIDKDFAICYMHDIVKEIGVLFRVERSTPPGPVSYTRSLCRDREHTILPLADGPRSTPLPLGRARFAADFRAAEKPADTEITAQRAEFSNLEATLARAISERDALAASAARWFEAVIAISAESSLLVQPARRHRWRKRLARFNGADRRRSPLALADRARDAGKWELAVRYYRDALELDPGDSEMWAQWGHALKQAGKTSEGELADQRSRELEQIA